MHATTGGACRCTRSTARPGSRPRRCCTDVDVLVVDLQDVGTRIYTYIYTMANCLIAAARKHAVRSSSAIGRIRLAEWRSRDRCSMPGFESFVGMYPDSDAPRHDHRRARAAVQRTFRHRRQISRSVAMDGWQRTMYHDDTRRAVGHAVAQSADPRRGHRVSRDRAVRGHQRLRRTRHDASVRAARRSGDRRGALRRTA